MRQDDVERFLVCAGLVKLLVIVLIGSMFADSTRQSGAVEKPERLLVTSLVSAEYTDKDETGWRTVELGGLQCLCLPRFETADDLFELTGFDGAIYEVYDVTEGIGPDDRVLVTTGGLTGALQGNAKGHEWHSPTGVSFPTQVGKKYLCNLVVKYDDGVNVTHIVGTIFTVE